MKISITTAEAVPLLLLIGCVTVDPEQDYDEATRLISDATGATVVYRPDEESEVRARVAGLLEQGLELDEAVEVALLNNPRLQRSFHGIGASRADLVQAGLLPNPVIGFAIRFPLDGGANEIEAKLAEEIADFWRLGPRERAAGEVLEATILTVAREASALATRTRVAYFEALAAMELAEIAGRNVGVARDLLLVAEAREEAGAGTQLEVNVALSERGTRHLEQRDADLALQHALLDLSSALGLEYQLTGEQLVSPLPDPPEWEFDEELLVDLAMQTRLDLRAAERAVSAALARLETELRSRFPNAELGLSYERADGTDGLGPALGVEIPLFDQNQAQIAKARYLHDAAEKNLAALRLDVRLGVLRVHRKGRIEWETAAFYRDELLPHNETNMKLSMEAYREGRVSFLTALEAQQRFLEARSEYVSRRLRSAIVGPELEQALGLPLGEARDSQQNGIEKHEEAQGDDGVRGDGQDD